MSLSLVGALKSPHQTGPQALQVGESKTSETPVGKHERLGFAAGFPMQMIQQGSPAIGKAPHMWQVSDLDRTADPRHDFYQFAVGGWVKENPIPEGYGSWGSFSELGELNNVRIEKLVSDLQTKKSITPEEQKIKDFYNSAMNEKAINDAGVKPLEPILALVAEHKISNAKDLSTVLGTLTDKWGVGGPYGCGSSNDKDDASWTMMSCDRSGISLDRDYYLEEGAKAKIKEQYQEHVGNMLALLGDADAKKKAEKIVALETELAKVYMSREMRRDPKNNYNKMKVADLQEKCKDGSMDWNAYFAASLASFPQLTVENLGTINVGDIKGIVAQSKIFKDLQKTDPSTLTAYFRWKIVHSFASFSLPKAFVDENFRFFSNVMYGVKDQKPRLKRAMGMTGSYLSMAIGKMFVKEHFSEETKKKALALVQNLRTELEHSLKTVEWIKNDKTREAALKKVSKFSVKIGYPDKWVDYADMGTLSGDHFENVRKARNFHNRRDLGFVNKATDRTEWGMSPQTINAYYDPSQNEICFPAGILQPPFFSADAHPSFNYGGIGAVIGHEMTHGFDDQGRKYDSDGNLKDWWTEEDAKEFETRAHVLVEQTNKFEIFGAHPNGVLTNGENLADLGGIKLAYGAMKRELESKKPAESLTHEWEDKFTTRQHFFLSYAKNWASNAKKESMIAQMAQDPHSPPQYRTNGPPSNLEEFHQAFETGLDKGLFNKFPYHMYREPEERVQLW